MRFYRPSPAFYCSVDLTAKSRYLCLLDRQDNILFHK
jgi:hypothetical protein